MTELEQKASYYFQSYHTYFWQWEIDDAFHYNGAETTSEVHGGINCINIPGGMTIAYKEQLEEILEGLSETCFPPFGALILTFLATNQHNVSFSLDQVFNKLATDYVKTANTPFLNLEEAHLFLKTLIKLDPIYKKGLKRVELFIVLFKNAHHCLGTKYAKAILKFIKNKELELTPCSQKRELTLSALSKDINTLALLHKKYPTTESILSAWHNLVNIGVEETDVESEPITETPDLIQELIEEPKTFFVGSLIKRLWSGIQLPMTYVHPGEMPLGGISDITNKGNFDNLLISEFANEDEIFLHRIANKEALFIRRETTPEEDLRTRIFLIDTSIKNWGTPKILSFATAFSLIHHPKNQMQFLSYVVGNDYKSIQFDTVENIIEGLQYTTTDLDASVGMQKFLDECEEENIEITLFTSPKTLYHQSIVRFFNQYGDKFGGIITADTLGNIDVYKLKNGSKRLTKSICLPLEELWKPPKRTKKSRNKKAKEQAIETYPLLYGYPPGKAINFNYNQIYYVLQKKGNLYRSTGLHKGFELIAQKIRFITGLNNWYLGTILDGDLTVVFFDQKQNLVVKTDRTTYKIIGDYRVQTMSSYRTLINCNETLYLVTRERYQSDEIFLEIDIENEVANTLTKPPKHVQEAYKDRYTNNYRYFSGSVFTKINNIAITEREEFLLNDKRILKMEAHHFYYENSPGWQDENTEASYVRRGVFKFNDGSSVKIDKNGIITFESSDPEIPTFYLTTYVDINLAMASEYEFAGNPYFLSETSNLTEIKPEAFKNKYIIPFIKTVKANEKNNINT